jgi:hypothetical protein
MKSARLVTIVLVTSLLLAPTAWASETAAPAAKDPQDLPHTAIYKVPELTTKLSKDLVKSLNEVDGILSAKPDTKNGTFAVTFAPAKTDTDAIQAAMRPVAPETTLDKVGPADPKQANSGCGGCPKKSSCAKKKG